MRRPGGTLERELLKLLGTGRNAGIAARYYGFDGHGGGSLQTVGNAFGLTRERVRQIVAAASKRLGRGRSVSRTLDRTLAHVADRMPAPAAVIEAGLRSEGLTSGVFRLEGIVKAVELLGRRLPFSITEVKGERLVHAPDIRSVGTIVRAARRAVGHWGMATLCGVATNVRNVEPGVDADLIASVLACQRDFHWLDRLAGWFWLSRNRKNPVLNRIRKILSVVNPICLSELQAGIIRDRGMEGFSPPREVLFKFCRQVPGLHVYDNTVEAKPRINPDNVLSQTEKQILRVLSEHCGAMTASELISVCHGKGVRRTTLYQCLFHSPIISRSPNGLYRVIGSGEKVMNGAAHRNRRGAAQPSANPKVRGADC